MGVLANAGENIECLPAVRTGILHPVRRDDEEPKMFREIRELPVDPIFSAQEMTLNFDEDVLAPKDGDQQLRAICGTPASARPLARRLTAGTVHAETVRGGRSGTRPRGGCAPQKSDQPARKLRQLVPLHGARSF